MFGIREIKEENADLRKLVDDLIVRVEGLERATKMRVGGMAMTSIFSSWFVDASHELTAIEAVKLIMSHLKMKFDTVPGSEAKTVIAPLPKAKRKK